MLALKKKREAEAKAAAEEAERAKADGDNGDGTSGGGPEAPPEKVSLLGIGGKKKNKNGEKTGGKKRSPGEIRIQKGKLTETTVNDCILWRSWPWFSLFHPQPPSLWTCLIPPHNSRRICTVYVRPSTDFWHWIHNHSKNDTQQQQQQQ